MSQIIDLFGRGPTPTDAAFLHIIESPRPEPKKARALIEALWQRTAPFVEHGIPNRLRFELHPCFWEMYLTAVLLDRGLPVMTNEQRRHRGGKGPDLQVGSVEAWFECISATAGEGPDAVPGYSFEDFAPVPDEAFKLRLTTAIREKFLKHKVYLTKTLVSESEPFVIAVNGGAVPHVYQEVFPPRILGALFPFGPEAIRFDLRTNTFGDSFFTYQGEIKKKSGVSIPTTFFEQEESCGISAVLYRRGVQLQRGVRVGINTHSQPAREGAASKRIPSHRPRMLAGRQPASYSGTQSENRGRGIMMRRRNRRWRKKSTSGSASSAFCRRLVRSRR
jgi:type I restriction enzyme S subunit